MYYICFVAFVFCVLSMLMEMAEWLSVFDECLHFSAPLHISGALLCLGFPLFLQIITQKLDTKPKEINKRISLALNDWRSRQHANSVQGLGQAAFTFAFPMLIFFLGELCKCCLETPVPQKHLKHSKIATKSGTWKSPSVPTKLNLRRQFPHICTNQNAVWPFFSSKEFNYVLHHP